MRMAGTCNWPAGTYSIAFKVPTFSQDESASMTTAINIPSSFLMTLAWDDFKSALICSGLNLYMPPADASITNPISPPNTMFPHTQPLISRVNVVS